MYYIIKNDDSELGTYTSFAEAINNWEEGYIIYDIDGVAVYPELNETEILSAIFKSNKGQNVKALQLLLIGYGYDLSPFGANSIFDSVTEDAVKDYQTSVGLEPTGIVDIHTWKKLLGR